MKLIIPLLLFATNFYFQFFNFNKIFFHRKETLHALTPRPKFAKHTFQVLRDIAKKVFKINTLNTGANDNNYDLCNYKFVVTTKYLNTKTDKFLILLYLITIILTTLPQNYTTIWRSYVNFLAPKNCSN